MFATSLIRKREKKFNKYINYPKLELENLKFYKYPDNHSLVGHAFEILFQIKYIKKNNLPINTIKAYRKLEFLKSINTKTSGFAIWNLKRIEKAILSNKYTMKDILYLSYISNIREEKDLRKKYELNDSDAEDLKELKNHIKYKKLIKEKINFNVYVKSNNILGEIDIRTKDSIIDIKTVSNGELKESYINQVILYYLMSKDKNIKKVGILFSRFGKLKMYKIKDLLSKKNEKKLRRALRLGED